MTMRAPISTIIDEMVRRKVNIPWTAFFKPGGLTDEIVERMKQTGFGAAEVGTDAACDTTLKRMGKSFTFSDVVNATISLSATGSPRRISSCSAGPERRRETVRGGDQEHPEPPEVRILHFHGHSDSA